MPKSNQLRVRLEDGQRERLLEIACARGKGERLSDIVRYAISEFITPEEPGGNGSHIVNVTSQCKQRVTELADELNRQYLIGYAAPPSHDGRWHAIKVEVVKKRGAKVPSRSGYFAVRGEAGRVTAIP